MRLIGSAFLVAVNLLFQTAGFADGPSGSPNPEIGTFGEYSLKTEDLSASIAYWKSLGFKILDQENMPYPYAILADGQTILGLHQSKDFQGPLLTYFAPDMSERIQKFQDKGVQFVKLLKDQTGHVIGGVMKSPEGQRIFLAEWK